MLSACTFQLRNPMSILVSNSQTCLVKFSLKDDFYFLCGTPKANSFVPTSTYLSKAPHVSSIRTGSTQTDAVPSPRKPGSRETLEK
jgi:hypothetical protein